MRVLARFIPSPAMAVALVALIVALGGTAYAVRSINGRLLMPRSVPGKALQKHTLTATEINLSKLGTVPSAATALVANTAKSATTAQTATTAVNAQTLGGQSPSAFERSGRILTGQASQEGGVILKDPLTGAVLSAGTGVAQLVVSNPAGSGVTLQVDLLISYATSPRAEDATIPPGSSAAFAVDAAAFSVATGELSALTASSTNAPHMTFTCQDDGSGGEPGAIPPSTVMVCTGLE
jgi:hypothetical protein